MQAHSSHTFVESPSARQRIADATRFWEPRRILYNLVLAAIAVSWVVATWPHFRGAMTLSSFLLLAILALLANVCYSAAYIVDISMQRSAPKVVWERQRWVLWLLGTLFAIVVENYWIADEIYPSVPLGISSVYASPRGHEEIELKALLLRSADCSLESADPAIPILKRSQRGACQAAVVGESPP
jgi:hypothetical protein